MEIAGFHINISMIIWYILAAVAAVIVYMVCKRAMYKSLATEGTPSESHKETLKNVGELFRYIRIGGVALFLILFPIMVMFFGVSKSTNAHDRIREATPDINYAKPSQEEIATENEGYKSSEYEKLKKESEERREISKESYEKAIKDSQ